jgi:hypothetical protein
MKINMGSHLTNAAKLSNDWGPLAYRCRAQDHVTPLSASHAAWSSAASRIARFVSSRSFLSAAPSCSQASRLAITTCAASRTLR